MTVSCSSAHCTLVDTNVCACAQVWISFAYFEATPCDILAAESELQDGETEAEHADRIATMRAAVPRSAWEIHETAARNVYSRGFVRLRENEPDAKAEAALLLDEWLRFERECKSQAEGAKARAVEAVEKKVPKRVKKRRAATGPNGEDLGMEEYLDYVFPDEDQAAPLAKLLAAAKRWQAEEAGT
jgi:crooked neck